MCSVINRYLKFAALPRIFFDVSVFHVLKSLTNDQELSVRQRFIASGIHADKSYVWFAETLGVVIYQFFDDINARVKEIIICFGKGTEYVAHNSKIAATYVNDIANVIVREELNQCFNIRHDNFFVVRTRARMEFFTRVQRLAPNVVGVYFGENFFVAFNHKSPPSFVFDFCPRVFQAHDAIKNQFIGCGVWVDDKIAQPQELIMRARARPTNGRFNQLLLDD